jgi:serine phosphatase RsbU (regulator of sigma subunit)
LNTPDQRQKVKSRKWRRRIVIASIFFIFFNILNILRNSYHKERTETGNGSGLVLNFNGGDVSYNPFPKKIKFRSGDDIHWSKKDLNDSDWVLIEPELKMTKKESEIFKGIAWFRIHFSIDKKYLQNALSIKLEHYGASEVYLDGDSLHFVGNVSADPALEETEMPKVPVLFSLTDTLEHVIAVRYSNHRYLQNFNSLKEPQAGITFLFQADATQPFLYVISGERVTFWFVVLFVFFLTLALVHLLLFAFYPKMRENLYYALFVLLFAGIMMAPYCLFETTSPPVYLRIKYYYVLLILLFMSSVGTCLYSLFRPSHWKKMMLIQGVLSLVSLIAFYTEILVSFNGTLIFSSALFMCIEAVRTVIYAIRKKMLGSSIIGAGVMTFFLFIFILIVDAVVIGDLSFDFDEDVGQYIFILVFMCIISIPLSMSIYLAYVFAFTNRNLEEKLVEVEELSARSIAQEKEKQQILSDQNVTLEKQVTERTLEIVEQKKVIEEKNKDIIDSINYAKRIQSAMLPEESVFKNIFTNSFILYQPRDIVSGDFYYAAELNGDKLIVAADCTGHGVPGALMSMVGCNIIQKLSNENEISDPKLLLETLHTELRSALKQNIPGSVNRDGMDLAAVLIRKNDILFSSANRPVIWFDHKNELKELKPTKTPVGGSHIEKVDLQLISLDKKEVKQLFLFSDGFADQFGGPEGKKLMVSKFKLWLNQIISLGSEEQLKFLTENFANWKNTNEQVDDVMVIGIKVM